jgi:hypothetical protein
VSTKIYYGFRCQLGRLGDATSLLRAQMWRNVVSFARSENVVSFEQCERFVERFAQCGIHIFIDQPRSLAYFSLFGIPRFCEIRRLGPLDRFSYWNNTDDRPRRVSYRAWRLRHEIWDSVLSGDGWERRLSNIVLDEGPFGSRPLYWALNPKRTC